MRWSCDSPDVRGDETETWRGEDNEPNFTQPQMAALLCLFILCTLRGWRGKMTNKLRVYFPSFSHSFLSDHAESKDTEVGEKVASEVGGVLSCRWDEPRGLQVFPVSICYWIRTGKKSPSLQGFSLGRETWFYHILYGWSQWWLFKSIMGKCSFHCVNCISGGPPTHVQASASLR